MREAVRCEKRRSFPEGKRSVRRVVPLEKSANTPGLRDSVLAWEQSGLVKVSGCERFTETYRLIFNALDGFGAATWKRSETLKHYIISRPSVGSPREWFGINFVTISATGVGVCSI